MICIDHSLGLWEDLPASLMAYVCLLKISFALLAAKWNAFTNSLMCSRVCSGIRLNRTTAWPWGALGNSTLLT